MSTTKKKSFVNPFNNPGVGRRTGVNVLEGKTIRKLENGMDNFDDYWSESSAGEDSLAALVVTPTPKQVAVVKGNSSLRSMTPFSAESQGSSALVDISNVAVPTITVEPAENPVVGSSNKTVGDSRSASRLGVSANPSFTLNQAGDETGTISRNETARSRTEPDTPAQGFKTKKRLTYSTGSDGKLTTPSSTQGSIKSTDSFAKPDALPPKRSTRASAQKQSTQVPEEQVSTKESSPKKSPKKSLSRASPRKSSCASMGQTNPDPIAAESNTTLEQSVATPSFEDHTHQRRTRSTRSATSKMLEDKEANEREGNNDKETETKTEESVEDEVEENESEVNEEIEHSTDESEQSGNELEEDSGEDEVEESNSEVGLDEEIEHSTGENVQSGNESGQNESLENEVDENESEVDEIEHSTGEDEQSGNEFGHGESLEDEVDENDVDKIEHSTGEDKQSGDDQNDSNEEEEESQGRDAESEVIETEPDMLRTDVNKTVEQKEAAPTVIQTPADTMSDTANSLSGFVSINPAGITKTQLTTTQGSTGVTSPFEEADSSNGSDNDDFAIIIGQDVSRHRLGRKGSGRPANKTLQKSKSIPVKKAKGDKKKNVISPKAFTNTKSYFVMSSDSEDEEQPIQEQYQDSPVKKPQKAKSKKQISSDENPNKEPKAKATGKKMSDSSKRSATEKSPISTSRGEKPNTKKQIRGRTTKQSSDKSQGSEELVAVKKGRPRGRPAKRKSIDNADNEKNLPPSKSPPLKGNSPEMYENKKKAKSTRKQPVKDPEMMNKGKTMRQRTSTRSSDSHAEQENELSEEEIPQKGKGMPNKSKTIQKQTSAESSDNDPVKDNKLSQEEIPQTGKNRLNKSKKIQRRTSTRSSDIHPEQQDELSEEEIPQTGKNRLNKSKKIQRRTSTRSSDSHLEQQDELSEEEIPQKGNKNRQTSKALSGTEAPKSLTSKRTTRKKSLKLPAETPNKSEEVATNQSSMQDIPVGRVSFTMEEEDGYDGDEDEGQVIRSAPEDDGPQAVVDESVSSAKSAASKRKSILKPSPASAQRSNSETSTGGDDGAKRRSPRKRSAPRSNADKTNNKDSYNGTPEHKSNSDVGDQLSPIVDKRSTPGSELSAADDELTPVLKKRKNKKSQAITKTPLSSEFVLPGTRRTIPDGRAQPRKSILKSEGTPRRSIASTHFAEKLLIYSSRKSEGTRGLPRYSSASPLHFTDVTRSQTPHPVRRKRRMNKIVPPRTPAEGIRRSRRTKVKPLEWFRNERIIYKPDGSGFMEVAGIDSPSDDDVPSKEKKLKRLVKKKRDKMKAPKTPRRLSLHKPFEEEVNAVQTTHVHVVNPDTKEEVSIDCIRSRDTLTYRGPLGGLPYDDDPFLMSKAIVQKVFSTGKLLIRPSASKERQIVQNDSMIFYIIHGKLGVEIHETSTILESGDFFFVPQGNTYSIKNLRHEEAKLVFYQHKH